MGRKTFSISDFTDTINTNLASDDFSEDEKSMLCYTLENVLKNSNNYSGFRWLSGTPSPGQPGFYTREYYLS